MTKFIVLFFSVVSLVCTRPLTTIGQRPDDKLWAKQMYFQKFFTAITYEKPKAYLASTSATLKCVRFFDQQNIFPTADVVNLMYQLNIDQLTADKVNATDTITTFQLPPAAKERYNERVKAYDSLSRPDTNVNALFALATVKFASLLDTFKHSAHAGYINTYDLDSLVKKTFPVIIKESYRVSKVQMDYFLNTLLDMNRLVADVNAADRMDYTKMLGVQSTAGNLLIINDLLKENNLKKEGGMRNRQPAASGAWYASYTIAGNEAISPPDYVGAPPNADIYVYFTKTGAAQPTLAQDAFEVYYGSNGLQYSLTANCDTLSFFKSHPLEHASTLPVILARGSYCFILRDTKTKQLYFRPDINLGDNKVYDINKLVKLPFTIEN